MSARSKASKATVAPRATRAHLEDTRNARSTDGETKTQARQRAPQFVVVDGGTGRTRSGSQEARSYRRSTISDPSLQARRLLATAAVAGLLFVALLANTVYLQFTGTSSDQLSQTVHQVLPAPRGEFLDRNGLPLAINDSAADIFIDSVTVTNGRANWSSKQRASLNAKLSQLARVLSLSSSDFETELKRPSHWTKLASKVDAKTAQQAREIGLNVVTVVDLPQRVYPDGDVARGVVGRVTDFVHVEKDGARWPGLEGKNGLEFLLNSRLEGRSGSLTTERGPAGREIPTDQRKLVPAIPGTSFVLCVDRSFQYEVDKILLDNVASTGSIGGYIGVMDVKTGDVLASSSVKTDKNGKLYLAGYNAGVIDTFEPGSPMKAFTMSAALDRSVMTTSDTLVVPDHYTMVFKHDKDKKFTDDSPHPTKVWTMGDILTNSSNVGTIKVAQKVGKQAIYDNLKAFGFGAHTGVADPAVESVGILRQPAQWSGVDIGTIAIGQGISVTPLQLLTGINTLAADGEYVSPRLVRAEIAPNGTRTDLPVTKRRVVSSETATSLRSMMAEVVREGTGVRAAVNGFEVAGKTGTAQKADRGHYIDGKYVASFSGFFPASAPELTIVVVLDEPYGQYGGLTAAPVFAQVVRDAAQRYQIAPRGNGVTTLQPVQRLDQKLISTPELRAAKDPNRTATAPPKPESADAATSTTIAGDPAGLAPDTPQPSSVPASAPAKPSSRKRSGQSTPSSTVATASSGSSSSRYSPSAPDSSVADGATSPAVSPPTTRASAEPTARKRPSDKKTSDKKTSDKKRAADAAPAATAPPSTAVKASSATEENAPTSGGLSTSGQPVTQVGSP